METPTISLEDYIKRLAAHDWFYDYSDDNRVWKAGDTERVELKKLTILSSDHLQAYNDAYAKHYSKPNNNPEDSLHLNKPL